jgi:hypothetical protein
VVQEKCKDVAAGSYVVQKKCKDVAAGSYVVQEKCKDVAAGSCRGSGIVQGHFCRQLMWFRESAKTLLLAVHGFQENF